jgi:hypothetical protein
MGGREVNLKYLGPDTPYDATAVTSGSVVPLLPDGRIVSTEEFLREYRGDSRGMQIILRRAISVAPRAEVDQQE